MNYQLPSRTYSEIKEITSNLYARAEKNLGLNLEQSLIYVEDETNLLRDEDKLENNTPLYVAILKKGFDLGIIINHKDPDFEYILNEFKASIKLFDVENYADAAHKQFIADFSEVRGKLGI